MTIYIIQGECGDYEENTTWLVRGFFSRDKAEAFCAAAQARMSEIQAMPCWDRETQKSLKRPKSEYDDFWATVPGAPVTYALLELEVET